MKIRTFALTTAAALFVAGSAFAQSSGGNAGQGTGQSGQNGIQSPMGTTTGSDTQNGTSNMTTGSTSGSMYKSDEEKMMYQNNSAMMRPFFTDDSMTTLKSEAEIKSAYRDMDAQSQASIKKSCANVKGSRGSYGTMTNTLCTIIGTV